MLIELVGQLKDYDASKTKCDVLAGLTVAVMLIPQGMAYALLAGLPPIYGLYAGFIPLLIYPLFGSSRELSVGPVALVSIIVLAGLSEMAEPGTTEFIELALLTALVAGVIQVIAAILKLGFLVNFLSEPVIKGFTAAAALIIGLSQMRHLLGLDLPRGSSTVEMATNLLQNIQQTNGLSLAIGLVGILVIIGLKKIKKSLPGALIAIVLSTIAVLFFALHEQGVDIVGSVPEGLPTFTVSFFDADKIMQVFPLAMVVCLISFIESLAIAKTIAQRQGYTINANKELLGLGLAKVVGAFFQAFPNTGSFTRSAINDDAGAKTGMSSIFAGVFIGLTLIFFTPLFYYLPKPVLAAIVLSAVIGLIDIAYAKKLFYLDRKDFYVLLFTFSLTLLLGIQQGVLIGVLLSLSRILYKSFRPHYAVLGRLEGTETYRNIKRFPEKTEEPIGSFIFRFDADLYFWNAEYFVEAIVTEIADYKTLEVFILDASSIDNIDSSGLHAMEQLHHILDKREISLLIAGMKGTVRDYLHRSGFQHEIGLSNNYLTVQDAVDGFIWNNPSSKLSREYAAQRL